MLQPGIAQAQAARYVQEIIEKCETFSTADKQYKMNDPMIEQREDGKFVVSYGMPVIDPSPRRKQKDGEAKTSDKAGETPDDPSSESGQPADRRAASG